MPGNPEGRAVQIAIGDPSAVGASLRLVDDLDAIEQELDVARARLTASPARLIPRALTLTTSTPGRLTPAITTGQAAGGGARRRRHGHRIQALVQALVQKSSTRGGAPMSCAQSPGALVMRSAFQVHRAT
jgi:hypothetical protein